MNHRAHFTFFFVLSSFTLGLPAPLQADAPKGYSNYAYDQAFRLAKKSGRNVFLYFGREGCAFCSLSNKKTFRLQSVRKLILKNYEMAYADSEGGRRLTLPDGERITEMQLGEKMNVLGTPVFLILDPRGKELVRFTGILKPEDFRALHSFIVGGAYRRMKFSDYKPK